MLILLAPSMVGAQTGKDAGTPKPNAQANSAKSDPKDPKDCAVPEPAKKPGATSAPHDPAASTAENEQPAAESKHDKLSLSDSLDGKPRDDGQQQQCRPGEGESSGNEKLATNTDPS